MNTNNLDSFIQHIPKAELHLHIEGTFEPELMFEIAERNRIALKYKSVDELKQAYQFSNLQDFLNIYYAGADVLLKEEDFYDLTTAYLEKVHSQNVIHTEIFFDPQTHTNRNVPFDMVINGITNALQDGITKYGISSNLIMCFLRDLSEESAFKTLESALPYKDKIIGVGLDSAEVGNPPSKFKNVFTKAKDEGFITVAHAGEEGPAEYVREALEHLNISRIDHGNNSLHDDELINHLVEKEMALTVCPLSNLKLQVVKDLKDHPIKTMLERGIKATVNSDDPAYFGGYMNENFLAITEALDLTKDHIATLVRNSFNAIFVDDDKRNDLLTKLDRYIKNNQ